MNLALLASAYFKRNLILPLGSLGIGLGVGVLFTVLSVFNGFVNELERNIKYVSGDITVDCPIHYQIKESDFRYLFAQFPEIASAEPVLNWFGLIGRRGSRGLDKMATTDLNGIILVGTDDIASTDTKSMTLSPTLAKSLGLEINDYAEIISQRPESKQGQPVRESFQFLNEINTGRFDQDLDYVYVNRKDLINFLDIKQKFTDWKIHLQEGYSSEKVVQKINMALGQEPFSYETTTAARTWRQMGGTLLRAAEDQRGTLLIVFGFIVMVAAYQLIATLLLLIGAKKRDIGILGALGCSKWYICRFFLLLSLFVSTVGIVFGIIFGQIFNANLSYIERLIGGGKPVFLPEIYKFHEIPVFVDWAQIGWVIIATYIITLLFSILPAWRATRLTVIGAIQSK
jgi:lipoprotein-releasing system permease protein